MWQPSPELVENARLTDFQQWLKERRGLELSDYDALWQWSVADLNGFWQAVWDFFDIPASAMAATPLGEEQMPGATWFPGARLNYVDQALRWDAGDIALIGLGEDGRESRISWGDLRHQVSALTRTLGDQGVGPSDRVVGYLPNIPEAIVAFLATASLGAVWSVVGQDYAGEAVVDRFAQLEPTVLIAADGYRFGGKERDRRSDVQRARAALPSLRATIVVPRLGASLDELAGVMTWAEALRESDPGDAQDAVPFPVDFDHPLWVLFSSGTTGLPKGMVQSHGGILLEHLKVISFHLDVRPGDRFWSFSSPSWMVWNLQASALLVGATVVCYDGSPMHPHTDQLWRIAAACEATIFNSSPGYLQACEKADAHPGRDYDLSALRTVGVSGSALPPSAYEWIYREISPDVYLCNASGGTDVCSTFAHMAPTVPVWAGEISVRCLGVALESWNDDGRPVVGEVGELVVTRPMPSMPVRFWNDADGSRYLGSYFDVFPGVWRHGDWMTLTDRGTVVIHGRSDATLNRHGVRMGSADIYSAVEELPEVKESLVVGLEQPGGRYWMPLFVVLEDRHTLDDALKDRIASAIRSQVSARHVPDDIIGVQALPHTRTGKRMEVPVKRVLLGTPAHEAASIASVDVPEALLAFEELRPL